MRKPPGQSGGWIAVLAALGLVASAQAALAAPREDFTLGQSARSGAVCTAVRDFDDPLAARAGARAWQVMCRGWTQTLGRIYAFHADQAAATQAWRASLAEHATCEPSVNAPDPTLPKTTLSACKTKPLGAGYLVYEAHAGHDVVAAEGYTAIGDVLGTAVKVALGRSPPPAATPASRPRTWGPCWAAEIENLNAVAEASAASPAKQKESAYLEAQLWQFGDAESRFSHLAETSLAGLGPVDRAEAYLNVAINASNGGRFAEAEAYFKAAAPLVEEANSPTLRALSFNILAAHARNQRRFEAAISLAQQAIAVRRSSAEPAASGLITANGPDLTLGRAGAIALNAQGKMPSLQLSSDDREAVRDAQAWQIIGTCQEALDRRPEARRSLQAALDILGRPRGSDVLGSAAPWLVVRLQVDLAGLDRADGAPQLAVRRIEAALAVYEPTDPDSLPLGRYILELARAKAASGQEDAALADFEQTLLHLPDQARRPGRVGGRRGRLFRYPAAADRQRSGRPCRRRATLLRELGSAGGRVHRRGLPAVRRAAELRGHRQRGHLPGAGRNAPSHRAEGRGDPSIAAGRRLCRRRPHQGRRRTRRPAQTGQRA